MKITNEHNEVLKAGCVVINNQQQVLLVLHDLEKNIWAFPKGHLEANETIEQAARRETLEETGYSVDIIKQLPDLTYSNEKSGESIRVAIFLAKAMGKPKIVAENTHSAWFTLETAKKLVYPHLIATVELAQG